MAKKQEVKRIDTKEFRELGFLQEVNRQFFHPLGLALEVIIDKEDGSERFGGIWDYRGDPEGMIFQESIMDEESRLKAERIEELRKEKAKVRMKNLGYVIQPFAGD